MAIDTPVNGTGSTTPGTNEPQAHNTTDAAAQMAHEFVDRVAEVARDSEERIRQSASKAESSLQQTLQTARVKASSTGDSLTDFVQQHPMAALGIAFGAGVLLSYITRSKASHYDGTD